jgi:hypothetical protein
MRIFIREVPASVVELQYPPACGRTPPQSTTTGNAAEPRNVYLIFLLVVTRNTVVEYLAQTPVVLCVKYRFEGYLSIPFTRAELIAAVAPYYPQHPEGINTPAI